MTSPERDDAQEVERRFREIIDGWHADGAPDDEPAWPDDAGPISPVNPSTSFRTPPSVPSQWRVPDDGTSLLDDEPDFVPPPPDPLPRDDAQFWLILITLVGGPLWVLYLAFFDSWARPIWWVLALATCVAGVVLLVLRQPKNHDDDEPDVGDLDDGP